MVIKITSPFPSSPYNFIASLSFKMDADLISLGEIKFTSKSFGSFFPSTIYNGKTSLCKVCISNKYTTEEARGFAYKYRYGITLEDYKNMYISQEGKCDICKESSKKLVVDHCHTNGNVRGLLCTACNSGLGFFKDNIPNLLEATKYLIKNNNK